MTRRANALLASIGFAGVLVATAPAMAQKQYDPGVTDTEIEIGNTIPYSGPASAYGIIGKTYTAFFKMINDQGGINGRKINFISYDDAYSPSRHASWSRAMRCSSTLRRSAPPATSRSRNI